MQDMREAYAKEAKKRKEGDKEPFFRPMPIVIACALIIGFTLYTW
jgi:hypothetical protein